MSPLIKALLGAALTLPLVAFVLGTLTTPEPVEEDRSRPVIIGRVTDDDTSGPDGGGPSPDSGRDARRGDDNGTDDQGPRDQLDGRPNDQEELASGGQGDAAPADPDHDGPTDDGGGSHQVVIPPPRNLDDGDDDGDDDDDDADADDSEGGSGGGSGGASGGD